MALDPMPYTTEDAIAVAENIEKADEYQAYKAWRILSTAKKKATTRSYLKAIRYAMETAGWKANI